MSETLISSLLTRALRPLVQLLHEVGVDRESFIKVCHQVYDGVEETSGSDVRSVASLDTDVEHEELLNFDTLAQSPNSERLSIEDEASEISVMKESVVVLGWHEDPDFVDQYGEPLELEESSGEKSFERLVERYGRGQDPVQLKEILLKFGIVRLTEEGKLKAVMRKFGPPPGAERLHRAISRPLFALLVNIYRNNSMTFQPFEKNLDWPEGIVAVSGVTAQHAARLRKHARMAINEFCAALDAELHALVGDEEHQGEASFNLGIGYYYFES